MFARHEEFRGAVKATPAAAFERLDDPTRLASHMSKRSWKMGWGKMDFTFDEGRGKAVGSHIRLSGRILGITLSLDEIVTDRRPPERKTWETRGEPRLLVIGPYRMGFEVEPAAHGAGLRVTIDYDLPTHGIGRVLGRLFGRWYAQWCTRQMVRDAQRALAA